MHATAKIVFLGVTTMSLLSGCSGYGRNGAVAPPSVAPESAADAAMRQYDKNHDGVLDQSEMAICPGILAVAKRYDSNNDNTVDRDELASQLSSLYSSGAAILSVQCSVYQSGRPVEGATVRFIPEDFLGGSILEATGITNRTGTARLAIPEEKAPASHQGLNMMQAGIYRVEIKLPSGEIATSKQPLGFVVDPNFRGGDDVSFNITN